MEALEEPPSEQREENQDDAGEEYERDAEADPEAVVDRAGRKSDDNGEHQQGQGVGDHGAADGDGHGRVFLYAEFADDRVGDEYAKSRPLNSLLFG